MEQNLPLTFEEFGYKTSSYFQENYLYPALNAELIEMTVPEKPNSPTQKYRLMEKGKDFLARDVHVSVE